MSLQRTKVNLLSHQYEFLTAPQKFVALIGGIGSGKSYGGAYYSIARMSTYPDALHFIGANSYSQLNQATLSALFKTFHELGIAYTYNENKGILKACGGTALCKSMDNYELHRGIEIGSFWLDEVRDLKREAFDMMMGRLRDKRTQKLEGRVTSSPSGFNWIYDYFHKDGENNTPEFRLINATSFENVYLPEGYLDSIKSMYSDSFYEQEILGQFVRGGKGSVFPWILTAKHPTFEDVKPKDINKWTLMTSFDPASTSTFGVIFFLFNQYTKKIIVFDEIYEKEMIKMTAKEIHSSVKQKLEEFYSKETGYKIVKEFEFAYDEAAAWFKNEISEIESSWWMTPSQKSRFGVDGYIALVRQCMALGLITITKNCVHFIKELEGYVKDDNGRIPKENDHLINAFQYGVGTLGLDFKEIDEPKPIAKEERRAYRMEEDMNSNNEYAEID